MADTEKTITSTGATSYTFEFEYLKPSDVKVSVAGEPWSEFTIPSSAPTTIQFNSEHVPANGAGTIRIYRDTTVDNLSATFYAGSAIKSQDLNDNFNQSLFVTQEAKRDIATAWQDGDDTVHSTEAWYTTDDKKIATTKAIQGRLDGKQNAETDLTNLSSCQTGGSSALAALTQTEIEILDGATVTTTELNYVDGVTSDIQTQLDARQDEDALLTAISGKSFRTSTDGSITTDSDTEIPSSKVVANHVASSISAIGGFEAIDDEDNFPSTIPVAGVIVSIADATGITVDSSGTSNTARTAGNGSDNVIINNFPASLRGGNGENANPFPLPNNTGLLVISTGSNHTYNFHRLLPTTDDVKQLSDDVNDFFARYRIANSAPNSANDDGDLWWDSSDPTATGRKMKVYDGSSSQWIDLVTSGEAFINTLTASDASVENGGGSSSFNGTAWRFKLSNPGLTAQHHIVSRAGVIQKPNAGTSQPSEGFAIDGNDIIFKSAPVSGTNIFVITIGSALSIGTPSDNTVTSAKIVDGAIVNADINASADIDGSKIADDTISEVKLDIHNAPSDNKVLKYGTTNGLEWGDPHPEGTDVKSATSATENAASGQVLKADGSGGASWASPMTLIDTITIGNNSSYTTNFGANWWNTYKYIKLIYFGSYNNEGDNSPARFIRFRHNSIDAADSYETMQVHAYASGTSSTDDELSYGDSTSGILGRFSSNNKFHIDCDIFSDGTNTSFKSSLIANFGARTGIFYTFLESAGSSFEFIQTSTNDSGATQYFPGTAKFYGIN